MPDHFQTDPFEGRFPSRDVSVARNVPPLPPWLAARILRPGEEVSLVRGPRWRPSWEPYVTHPLLFGAALVAGALCIAAARLVAESWAETHPLPVCFGVLLALGSVYVLAFFNAYFTR